MKKFAIVLPLLLLFAASLACSRADVPVTIPVQNPATPTPFQPMAPTPTGVPIPTSTPLPAHISREEIEEGTVVLEIPRIAVAVKLEVSEGEEPPFVRDTPKWVPELSETGLPGISLIYGERQWGPIPKIFTDLDELGDGDLVIIRSPQEELTFLVYETIVIDPDQVWTVIDQFRETGGSQIALVTCTPWGTAKQRLIVFAALSQQGE